MAFQFAQGVLPRIGAPPWWTHAHGEILMAQPRTSREMRVKHQDVWWVSCILHSFFEAKSMAPMALMADAVEESAPVRACETI